MYFRLFACCLLVRGAKRSLISDVQRSVYFLIPNELQKILADDAELSYPEILAKYGPENSETIVGYVDFLNQNELIFWCEQDELALFPPISMQYEEPAHITNAIIDINAQSTHNFENLFGQLDELGCSHIQIRSYTAKDPTYFVSLLAAVEAKRILSVELLTAYSPNWQPNVMAALLSQYPRLISLTLHSAPAEVVPQPQQPGLWITEQIITDQTHCGIISPAYFSINLSTHLESQQHNTCLNRKLSIDATGWIKNCPSLPDHYGHSKTTKLADALNKPGFQDRWLIHKDQIEICRDCEFRHICTDCRAYTNNSTTVFAKPAKCNYDPYTATWGINNLSANPLHSQ